MTWIENLAYDDRGLIAAIAQDGQTGDVLMLAWMSREAVERTIDTGVAHFWSRSRGRLWRKGESSGNELQVEEMRLDCDGDTLLLLVKPLGPACHTGEISCFHRTPSESGDLAPVAGSTVSQLRVLDELGTIIRARRDAPADTSYTAQLLAGGVEKISKKVGEECFETAVAAATQSDARLAEEAADLLYHLLVLLEARGLTLAHACAVLDSRRSGWNANAGNTSRYWLSASA